MFIALRVETNETTYMNDAKSDSNLWTHVHNHVEVVWKTFKTTYANVTLLQTGNDSRDFFPLNIC